MTVSTSTNSVVYRGNGAATQFAVPFKVLDEAHLVVTRRDYATGEELYTYVGTDYTYSGIGDDAGTLTLAGTALDDDYELVIERIVPYTQDLDIVNAGGFYPETVEEQLDLITMGIQQVAGLAGRGIVVPVGEDGLELPKASDRAGKFPVFDAAGQVVMSSGTGNDAALRTDLAGLTGPALIGFTDGGIGASTLTLQEVLRMGPLYCSEYNVKASNSATVNTAAMANLIAAAQSQKRPILATEICTLNANIVVPTGEAFFPVSIYGLHWRRTGFIFDGAAVTHGFHFVKPSYTIGTYDQCGGLSNLYLEGINGAKRGASFENVNHAFVDHCHFQNFDGAGVWFYDHLYSRLEYSTLRGCGSATEEGVVIDGTDGGSGGSTTFLGLHTRIGGGLTGGSTAKKGGWAIDRTFKSILIGCYAESTGTPFAIGLKSSALRPVQGFKMTDCGAENPGDGNPYIDVGSGWTGTAGRCVDNFTLDAFASSPSGTTDTPFGVRLANTMSFESRGGTKLGILLATGTAFYEFIGTNTGAVVRATRTSSGTNVPYVRVGGAQRLDAGPRVDWLMDGVAAVEARKTITLTATTAVTLDPYDGSTLAVPFGQGGIHDLAYLTCSGGATDINGIMFGQDGSEFTIVPLDANATFKHLTGPQPRFRNRSGADVVGATNIMKRYRYNSNTADWHELF